MARPALMCPHGLLGVRKCKQCKRESGDKSYKQKMAINPRHAAEYARKWRIENPERHEAQRIRAYAKERSHPLYAERSRARGRKHLGIPGGSETRQGNCPICGKHGMLVPDHDHATGMLREWICNICNLRLGVYEKNMEKFDAYLSRFERRRLNA